MKKMKAISYNCVKVYHPICSTYCKLEASTMADSFKEYAKDKMIHVVDVAMTEKGVFFSGVSDGKVYMSRIGFTPQDQKPVEVGKTLFTKLGWKGVALVGAGACLIAVPWIIQNDLVPSCTMSDREKKLSKIVLAQSFAASILGAYVVYRVISAK